MPLPSAVSGLRAFIAEKSFVNDVTEMLGAAAADDDVLVALVALAELVLVVVLLLLELPHPAATTATAIVKTTLVSNEYSYLRAPLNRRETSTSNSSRRSSTPARNTLANRNAAVHCD